MLDTQIEFQDFIQNYVIWNEILRCLALLKYLHTVLPKKNYRHYANNKVIFLFTEKKIFWQQYFNQIFFLSTIFFYFYFIKKKSNEMVPFNNFIEKRRNFKKEKKIAFSSEVTRRWKKCN